MESKIQIIKTIKEWAKETGEQEQKCLKEEKYNAYNYYSGKTSAYTSVIHLIQTIADAEIPFELT